MVRGRAIWRPVVVASSSSGNTGHCEMRCAGGLRPDSDGSFGERNVRQGLSSQGLSSNNRSSSSSSQSSSSAPPAEGKRSDDDDEQRLRRTLLLNRLMLRGYLARHGSFVTRRAPAFGCALVRTPAECCERCVNTLGCGGYTVALKLHWTAGEPDESENAQMKSERRPSKAIRRFTCCPLYALPPRLQPSPNATTSVQQARAPSEREPFTHICPPFPYP